MDKYPNYAFIDGNNLHQGAQVDDWVTNYLFYLYNIKNEINYKDVPIKK